MAQANQAIPAAEVRRQFVAFFQEKHGHTFVPSAPVVPHDDPTLLFTNAGMNPFKPIFLGEAPHPDGLTRVVNSQKCIRAGGKHNDLDDVGRDTYHHTFFEMLGNWSFGDYFKAEAIDWAWELLTGVWGLDPERLHATYFEGDPAEGLEPDHEARDLWRRHLPEDRVHPGNKKDNFWEMGETGPCGPCSELHYDRSPGKTGGGLVNADGQDTVIEIWNLVFIQFNRGAGGLTPLPAKHVDTGMGFERIVAVLNGKASNYDTDVFAPLFEKLTEISGKTPSGELNDPTSIAFRAIADHARMATFAIADGATPENKGRGSVLRSVIRRAVRFGYQTLGLRGPFLHKLVPVVQEQMSEAFPGVGESDAARVIEREEVDFLGTVERGLGLFEEAAATGGITGIAAFDLHTTYGFPIDLTRQLAEERGLAVDMAEYERLFTEFQRTSGKGRRVGGAEAVDLGPFPPTDDKPKYAGRTVDGTVLGWIRDGQTITDGKLEAGDEASVLLDRTSFYAEQGGQVGDVGTITTATGKFLVADTERRSGHVLHWGQVAEGHLAVGQRATADVDRRRADIMRNHTATHLLNLALRRVLGDHVQQKGSLVDHEKLRFDFAHDAAVTPDELQRIERIVNGEVRADRPVRAVEMPLAEAQAIEGVKAVFGEKYPDPVRVVAVGEGDARTINAAEFSVEFCGGTHLTRSGEIGFLKIVAEESVSRGVRRVTAVTGAVAVERQQAERGELQRLAQQLAVPVDQVSERVAALQAEVKTLKKQLKSGGGGGAARLDADALLRDAAEVGGVKLIVADTGGAGPDAARAAIDALKKKGGDGGGVAVLLGGVQGDKVMFVAGCSDAAIKAGLKAGDWVKAAATVAGGGGGGRPDMAQAGGRDPTKLADALHAARAFAGSTLA